MFFAQYFTHLLFDNNQDHGFYEKKIQFYCQKVNEQNIDLNTFNKICLKQIIVSNIN